MNNWEEYFKAWIELYPHFCFHLKTTSKEITDERIFKEYFTFERWKKGFWTYKSYKKLTYNYPKLDSVNLKNGYMELEYNIFHGIPFNIKKRYYECR